MFKRSVNVIIILVFSLTFFIGCSSNDQTNNTVLESKSNKPVIEKKTLGIKEFEELLSTQHVFIESTEYAVQSQDSKVLYPDLLMASVKNNSNVDIKNVVVSFVAWDENNLPVKIEGQFDFGDGSYVRNLTYSDINLPPAASSTKDKGFALDSDSKIKTFKAIAKSYETFDGVSWENPYYDDFVKMYKEKKFSDDMSVELVIKNSKEEVKTSEKVEKKNDTISEEELNSQISGQPVVISKTEHIITESNLKSLYPDILAVAIQNNSDKDVKNVVVSFVAWDENNLPVKVEGQFDFDSDYVRNVNFSDVNLIPNGVYDKRSGVALSDKSRIKKFKAIVKSYENFDGTTWDNPLYEKFRELYVGKKLA